MTHSSIRDNHSMGKAGDFIHEQIKPGAELSFVSAYLMIIRNQKRNPRYDYASNEQIEIGRLAYEAYGLNAEDVEEVENWYARRYSKLSAAQKENFRRLGKSDDYLVLYGLKKKKL